MSRQHPKILFVCTGNAGRNQMAETLCRDRAGETVEVFSAGVEPGEDLPPTARRVMAEKGLPMAGQYPKHVKASAHADLDVVVTIGDRAELESPNFNSRVRRVHWQIDDPADAGGTDESEPAFRHTLEQIDKHVTALLTRIDSLVTYDELAWQPAMSTAIVRPARFDPATHLPMFIEAGFRMIELCCFRPHDFDWEDPSAIRTLCRVADDLGVKIWSIHPPDRDNLAAKAPTQRETQVDVIRGFVDIACELGSACLSIHAGGQLPTDSSRNDVVSRLRDSLYGLGEYVRRTPVVLCIETLFGTSDSLSNPELLAEVDVLPRYAYGTVIDTGHSHIAGDLYGMPRLAGRRLHNLHLNDNDALSDQHQIPGCGTIDWQKVMDDLRTADYTSPLMFEIDMKRPESELKTLLSDSRQAVEKLLELSL